MAGTERDSTLADNHMCEIILGEVAAAGSCAAAVVESGGVGGAPAAVVSSARTVFMWKM